MESSDFRENALAVLPRLRALALSLAGDRDRADDLVQETLTRAWIGRGGFTAGTRMDAWFFTILRNEFVTDYRKRRREVRDLDGTHAAKLAIGPDQHAALELKDCLLALGELVQDQRIAILLVGAEGLSFEEAAEICGVPTPTLKNRVYRGRRRLSELLDTRPPAPLARAARPRLANHGG